MKVQAKWMSLHGKWLIMITMMLLTMIIVVWQRGINCYVLIGNMETTIRISKNTRGTFAVEGEIFRRLYESASAAYRSD